MKNWILLLALGCSFVKAQAEKPAEKYVDATSLTIIGKALPTEQAYNRIDTTRFKVPNATKEPCYESTGLAVVFRTDSPFIHARWTTSDRNSGSNMTAIAQKGLDLYIRRDGKWVFAGVGNPTMNGKNFTHHASEIVNSLPDGEKECLLYLPLYDQLEQLEIGISPESHITPMENPFRHKIVVHGSSITHGASASRAGMSYVARMERNTGLYLINLGFSGQCTMQPEFADYLAGVEADAFIFDCFSNPNAEWIAERFNPFVDRIRAKHPTTPLIFMQTEIRETTTFNSRAADYEARKRAEAEKQMKERMKTDKNLYFINPGMTIGNSLEATVDGVHPTDVGFTHMIDNVEPKIVKILKKYGIQ